MRAVPISVRDANKIIGSHPSSCTSKSGIRFAVGAKHKGKFVGAIIVGNFNKDSSLYSDKNGYIFRLGITPDAPSKTALFLDLAASKAWRAMGGGSTHWAMSFHVCKILEDCTQGNL